MFTCRSCRLMFLHFISRFRYRSMTTSAIVLLLTIFLLYELAANVNNISTSSQESLYPKGYQHRYAKPDCSERTRFVYIKMIKCASTTLTDLFRRFGLQRSLTFVLPPRKRIYIGWPYQVEESLYRPTKSMSGFDILCDHAVYNKTKFSELMPPDTVYIASLREPFSQVKSMVNYYNVLNISRVPMTASHRFTEFMTNIEKYEAVYKSAEASPTRYCIPNGFSMTRNLMSFNLGFPTGGFRSEDEDQAHDTVRVRQWISELDSQFHLVLIVEYFYESMVLLRRLMCWSLSDILFQATNAGSYEYRKQDNADLARLYRKWSSVDYHLYQHFNNSLWKKIAEQDSSFWDEVDHYRSVNVQVSQFCAGEVDSTFLIPESVWNPEFYITTEICQLLAGDLLGQVQALYDSQPPTDIMEKQPSRDTC